jgi:hypothetical protein
MMNFQLIPVLTPGGSHNAGLPAKHPQSFGETLNELVVVVFFSLGPVLGATIFLLWFGGLMWGLFSSFFR